MFIFVTVDVCHWLISWLNRDDRKNICDMSVTEPVSQAPILPLKDFAWKNIICMAWTLDVCHAFAS